MSRFDDVTELPALALGAVAWRAGTNEFPVPTDLLTDLAAGDWTNEALEELLSEGEVRS